MQDELPEGFRFERSEVSIKVPEGARIEASNLFGDIRARSSPQDGELALLGIVQQFDTEGAPIEVEHAVEDGVVRIRTGVRAREGAPLDLQPRRGQRKRADLVLFVPKGVPLQVRTGHGLVQLRGLRSDVEARSGSGEMQIRSVKGAMDLASDSGDMVVILEPVGAGQPQRFRLGSGNLELHLREEGSYALTARSRGRILTDFSLDIGGTARDGSREATMATGTDGAPVRIDSGTGFIKLVRKPSAEASFVPAAEPQP